MEFYCARLLVVCLVNDKEPQSEVVCDYPFVLFRAENELEAFSRALTLGKKQEGKYQNVEGKDIRWVLVKVEEIKRLGNALDGVEVGSLLDVYHFDKPVPYTRRFRPDKVRPYYSEVM